MPLILITLIAAVIKVDEDQVARAKNRRYGRLGTDNHDRDCCARWCWHCLAL